MIILGTLKKRLSQTKTAKGQLNHFHPHAETFFYPVLHLLTLQTFLSQPLLLAKTLFSLSLILDASQNHLKIEDFSSHTFKMWQRLRYCYSDSEEVTVNFVFLMSKLRRISV
jgi:hypothetical protein